MKIILPKYLKDGEFHISGIYFLIKRNKIVYIGQSGNVFSRLLCHKYRIPYDKIRIISCGKKNRVKYEQRWINKFQPKWNGLGEYGVYEILNKQREYREKYKARKTSSLTEKFLC